MPRPVQANITSIRDSEMVTVTLLYGTLNRLIWQEVNRAKVCRASKKYLEVLGLLLFYPFYPAIGAVPGLGYRRPF